MYVNKSEFEDLEEEKTFYQTEKHLENLLSLKKYYQIPEGSNEKITKVDIEHE